MSPLNCLTVVFHEGERLRWVLCPQNLDIKLMASQRGSGIGELAEITLEIGIALTLGEFLRLGNIGAANKLVFQIQNLRQENQFGFLAIGFNVLDILFQVFGFILVSDKHKDNLCVGRDGKKPRFGDVVLNQVENNNLARQKQLRLLFEGVNQLRFAVTFNEIDAVVIHCPTPFQAYQGVNRWARTRTHRSQQHSE